MNENNQIQKATKFSLMTITQESHLAVRGLKDLELLNTPRLKYLAGLYNECIELCVEMEKGIEAPEPKDETERRIYDDYGPKKYIIEPIKLGRKDYWYWNLSLQKIGRFFIPDKRDTNDDKGWAYPMLLSKNGTGLCVGTNEYIDLFNQRLRDNLVCNADYWYYAICLEKEGDVIGAIENFNKAISFKVESKHFQKSAQKELSRLEIKLKEKLNSKNEK